MNEALAVKIRTYYEARAAYDAAKKISDEHDAVRRAKEQELVDYMLEQKIKSVKLEDGTTPTLVNTVSIRVVQENYDEIRTWLRNTVGDDADFLVTIPHKPAIVEYVKRQIEQEKLDDDDFPAFLQCSTRPAMRVTGWKGRE